MFIISPSHIPLSQCTIFPLLVPLASKHIINPPCCPKFLLLDYQHSNQFSLLETINTVYHLLIKTNNSSFSIVKTPYFPSNFSLHLELNATLFPLLRALTSFNLTSNLKIFNFLGTFLFSSGTHKNGIVILK
uniref:Putative ovule protein n=1 Tax=Solanum chacoense TaxID=4108 RepID=A0A0V0HH36_SOLCH